MSPLDSHTYVCAIDLCQVLLLLQTAVLLQQTLCSESTEKNEQVVVLNLQKKKKGGGGQVTQTDPSPFPLKTVLPCKLIVGQSLTSTQLLLSLCRKKNKGNNLFFFILTVGCINAHIAACKHQQSARSCGGGSRSTIDSVRCNVNKPAVMTAQPHSHVTRIT